MREQTLLTIDVGGEQRFPAMQFTDGSEVPDWAIVCREFPTDRPVTAASAFMFLPSCDLIIDDEQVTPRTWLVEGQDPTAVMDLIRYAFSSYS